MGISKNRGTPKWIVSNGKSLLKLMIWGYHHLRKHPYRHFRRHCMYGRFAYILVSLCGKLVGKNTIVPLSGPGEEHGHGFVEPKERFLSRIRGRVRMGVPWFTCTVATKGMEKPGKSLKIHYEARWCE